MKPDEALHDRYDHERHVWKRNIEARQASGHALPRPKPYEARFAGDPTLTDIRDFVGHDLRGRHVLELGCGVGD